MNFDQWDGRRFYLLGPWLRKRFPFRVRKITIDAGFTCPNLDGTLASKGCIYCNNRSFSPVAGTTHSVREQIQKAKSRFRERKGSKEEKYLAYFQAYSNTYDSVENLRSLYDEALADPDIIGLDIGTRPDCVPNPVLDLIESYTDRGMVWVEYGLQSASDLTLRKIGRLHDVDCFIDAVERTKDRGIYICAHVILGFPWESREEALNSIRLVSDLGVDGIKIHHLYVAKNTPLEKAYRRGQWEVLTWPEYRDLLIEALEILDPSLVIHRLAGDLYGDLLVAPQWGLGTSQIYREINQLLKERDSHQGCRFEQSSKILKNR